MSFVTNLLRLRPQRSALLRAIVVIARLSLSGVSHADDRSPDSDGGEQQQPVVVVELFTSQGCSSCPPADANLRQLRDAATKTTAPVYALSFHVDYWNRLGWTDPYSSPQASRRQQQYARLFRSGRVYTPQMIVNGMTEFVGSDRRRASAAIRAAQQQSATAKVTGKVIADSEEITVSWSAIGIKSGDVINIALVEDDVENNVPRGENAGRGLHHVNVVRDLRTVRADSNDVTTKFAWPKSSDPSSTRLHVIIYLQSPSNGRIRGATRLPVTSH